MAAITAANAIQQKTGSANANATAAVALDNGTQAGSTVTIEIWCGGVPITGGGLGGRVPVGFETDAYGVDNSGSQQLYVFRKRNVAAGEGVAGSTSWDFTYVAATNWYWRVTEWDTTLEPVSPLEIATSNFGTGTGVTSLSTGTTTQNGRANTVCLAWHHWHRAGGGAPTVSWSGHDNGFVERDELRGSSGTTEYDASWSWAFNTSVGTFSCTASNSISSRSAQDVFFSLIVVYAAITYS